MDRLSLHAEERQILGKKVKTLRRDGKLPGHVFGKALDSEAVSVNTIDFIKTFHLAGATGVIDLKIGKEKVRPVLIREVQYDPVADKAIHVDFYQVDLTKKVKVAVPIVLIGEEPEKVHLGEAIILQTLNEIEVEALPEDLLEKIEVDIAVLKEIDDSVVVGKLNYDREKLIIAVDPEEIVVKLAPAVTAEMEKLLEEEAAEQAATVAEEAGTTGGAEPAEGEVAEGEEGEAGEGTEGDSEKPTENQDTDNKENN